MKRTWRLSVVFAVTASVLLFVGAGAALAVDLSNTQISLASFLAGGCGGLVTSLVAQPFTFEPGGADGVLNSIVFAGCAAGGSAGLFFYGYDIVHSAASSELMIHGWTADWQNLVAYDFPESPGGAETSFWITATGNKHPTDASIIPSFAGPGTLSFDFAHANTCAEGDHICPGEESVIFGAVSTLPPGTVFANLINTGEETSAMVLVPVPEPASLLLLSSGLMGLAGLKASRRRKMKALSVA